MDAFFFFLSEHVWYVFVLATVGGAAVAWGLWLEMLSEKDIYRSVADFRKSKKVRRWGERFVLKGVIIETLVAGLMTWKEAWESKAHDPNNQSISTIEVVRACVEIRGTDSDDESLSNIFLTVGRPAQNRTNRSVYVAFGRIASRADVGTDHGWNRRYEMDFRFDPFLVGSRPHLTANDLNSIDLDLPVKWSPTGTIVVWGEVRLIINGSIQKNFLIPPQTNFFYGATSCLTNGSFVPLTLDQKRQL